jgi:prepilin-type N-terminal cleavage/methylation domain-containing protein
MREEQLIRTRKLGIAGAFVKTGNQRPGTMHLGPLTATRNHAQAWQLVTRNSQRPSGFTLIELTIVLFLMALMLGLSTLFFANTLPSSRLNAAGRELSATIRQARSLAQSNGTAQTVVLDFDARKYGIEGRGARSLPQDVGIRVIDPLYGAVQQGTYRVSFDATGGVEGAAIELWNNKRLLRIVTDPIVGTVTLKQ